MSNVVTYILDLQNNLSGGIQDATQKVNALESAMGSLKTAAVAALSIGAVTAFGKSVIDAGTMVENATTGLTTLLGSASEAARVVKNEMEDATKTPFAFEGLLNANKALISAGVNADKARKDVLNLSNAIAATGGGDVELQRMVVNMQQISNTGKATSQDIKQFAFAGINIYKVLAEATGKPIEKVKDMEVSYDLLTMALEKAHQKGGIYYNGLENMANNTSVKISNVGDAMFQFMNSVFVETKPLIDETLSDILSLISSISNGFQSLIHWLKENKQSLETVGVAILAGAAAFGVMTVAMNASAIAAAIDAVVMGTLATVIDGCAIAMEFLNATFIASPIGWIVLGVAGLAAGVMALIHHFGSFQNAMKDTWEIIKAFGTGVVGVFKGIGETIIGALTFNPAMIKKGAQDAIKAAKDAGTEISAIWNNKDAQEAAAKGKNLVPKETKGATGKDGKAAVTAAEPKTKAQGQKNVNIHIAINGGLIHGDFKIVTNKISEGMGKVKDIVAEALTGAINDSQIIATN